MDKMNSKNLLKLAVMAVFLLLLPYAIAENEVELRIPKNLTILPDTEFAILVSVLNGPESGIVKIKAISPQLGINLQKETFMSAYTKADFEFSVPPNKDVGNYEIYWEVWNSKGIVLNDTTSVHISVMKKVVGDILEYYQNWLERLGPEYDGEYMLDAQKNIKLAEELYKNGMLFEAMKYLDNTRVSITSAISLETEKKIEREMSLTLRLKRAFKDNAFLFYIITVVVFMAVLVVAVINIKRKLLKRQKIIEVVNSKDFGPAKLNEVIQRPIEVDKNVRQPATNYIDKLKLLSSKISKLKDESMKAQLNEELKRCEEKYKLGLTILGDAYYNKIKEKVA